MVEGAKTVVLSHQMQWPKAQNKKGVGGFAVQAPY
jgi:hypothetical protein